jgi:hypothetical protein
MRSDLAQAIKDLLAATGQFGSVIGLGGDQPVYPLARVWIKGCPKADNLENRPEAMLDLRVIVRIEARLAKDGDGNSIDGPLYDLADTAFNALHNIKLPGKGSLPLVVYDHPGLRAYNSDGPAAHTMQVSARVLPQSFSLT